MDADAYRRMALEAVEDQTVLNDMTEEQIMALRRAINPAGGIVDTKKTYVNMSIYNWSDKMRQKQLTMSFIGFFSRLISEYEPDAEKEVIMQKYESQISAATGNARKKLIKKRDEEIAEITKIHRNIIRTMFNKHFDFDPDRHVAGSKSAPLSDKERQTLYKKVQEEMEEGRKKAAEEALRKEDSFAKLQSIASKSYGQISSAVNELRVCVKALSDNSINLEDAKTVIYRRTGNLQTIRDNLAKVVVPLMAAGSIEAYKLNPPLELFHNFERYMAAHFEFINDLTVACYREKPDIEFMIRVYSTHTSAEDAANYLKQHERDFSDAAVLTLESGGTTLLGPYKANRDRVAYYSQNTEVLRLLNEQAEQDAKLGADMIKKAVRKKKAENIKTDGPDRPGLAGYRSDLTSDVAHHGAKKEISKDEMEQMVQNAGEKMDPTKMAEIAASIEVARGKKASDEADQPEESHSSAAAPTQSRNSHSSAAAAAAPVQPQYTAAARAYNMFNLEEHYHDTEPDGEFDAKRRTGTYSVNDTDDSEQPADSVACQMFIPKQDENGNQVLTSTMLYTQAEAPLHLERDSPYKDSYQPIRSANVADSLSTEIITNEQGQRTRVTVVKKQ